jgi:hypothetical protein
MGGVGKTKGGGSVRRRREQGEEGAAGRTSRESPPGATRQRDAIIVWEGGSVEPYARSAITWTLRVRLRGPKPGGCKRHLDVGRPGGGRAPDAVLSYYLRRFSGSVIAPGDARKGAGAG